MNTPPPSLHITYNIYILHCNDLIIKDLHMMLIQHKTIIYYHVNGISINICVYYTDIMYQIEMNKTDMWEICHL